MEPKIPPENKTLIMAYMVLELSALKSQTETQKQEKEAEQKKIQQELGLSHEEILKLGEAELTPE
ncbi:MAG: hypothetical protein WCO09_00810 [bacterium]